jgi:hypothetical protein
LLLLFTMKKYIIFVLFFAFCSNNNLATDAQSNWCVAKADLISRYTFESYRLKDNYVVLKEVEWRNNTPEDIPLSYYNYSSAKDIYKTTILKERFENDEVLNLVNHENYSKPVVFFDNDVSQMEEKNKSFHEDTNYSVWVFTPLIDGERQDVEATYSKYNTVGRNWGPGTELSFFSYLIKDQNQNSLEICKIWEELSY